MAVVVQAMVPAETSGVMNTVFGGSDPDVVEIEAGYGLGSALVDGEITPDRYLIHPSDGEFVDRHISRQTRMLVRGEWVDVSSERQQVQKLPDEAVLELARLGKTLERELGGPLDVEFALAEDRILIVQARPLTGVQPHSGSETVDGDVPPNARLVASGLKGKTAAIWRAKCQVLSELSEADQFEDGNILVVTAATPAWDGVIFRASALVTNDGGPTSHAIGSRMKGECQWS